MIQDSLSLGLPLALACAITAMLPRHGKRPVALWITAYLAVAAGILIRVAATSDDDYTALFTLLIGQLAALLALGAAIGLGAGLIWQAKRG